MLSIIYTYRNRDIERIKYSFNSLKRQTSNNFQVYFVDYGSRAEISEQVKKLCTAYDFVNYTYCNTSLQPWNKSKALNIIIKNLETKYCFVADVDMIFHPQFVEITENLKSPNTCYYFQVGFLDSKTNLKGKTFEDFKKYRLSDAKATGLSLFPVDKLQRIRGFDEFYHLWGAEDTDVHVRLKNIGVTIKFYNNKILLLHQWHQSYRILEKMKSHQDFSVKSISRINHHHLMRAQILKKTVVNPFVWGECLEKEEEFFLVGLKCNEILTCEKTSIDHLFLIYLQEIKGPYKLRIQKHNAMPFKRLFKKFLGKDILEYYTLEEVKDKLLLHIITFFRDYKYIVQINHKKGYIEFGIDKST